MEDFFVFLFEDAAASDAATGFEREGAVGGLFDETYHHCAVEVFTIEDAHDARVVTARVGFGFGDDGTGLGLGSARDTARREETEEEIAEVGGVIVW